MKKYLSFVLIVFVACFFISCGSSDNDDKDQNISISGVAHKGPVLGGTVEAYPISNGAAGTDIIASTATSIIDGSYNLHLGDYEGDIIVVLTGGQYKDEATGEIKALNCPLRAVVPNVESDNDEIQVAVTPLTEIVVRLLEKSNFSNDSIVKTNKALSALLGTQGDILSTLPADVTLPSSQSATDEAKYYGLLMAAFSQMDASSEGDICDIIDSTTEDIADGLLQASASQITTALSQFITENANNQSGITELPEQVKEMLNSAFDIIEFDPADVDNDNDGISENNGDCNDSDSSIYPGATEICGDGIDQNCDGIDLVCPENVDDDKDGFTEKEGDLNDADATIFPGAEEICGDGIDQDCDGSDLLCPTDENEVDDDEDGYTENQGDCNDTDSNIYPGAEEICEDGIDQDCDGSDLICPINPDDVDDDNDGYTETEGDCDDTDSSIHPGEYDTCGDGIDQDCNGADAVCDFPSPSPAIYTYYKDNDGDGFGDSESAISTTSQPSGYVNNDQDCDDTNAAINPNSVWGIDADSDTYFSSEIITACQAPSGYTLLSDTNVEYDCNDADESIYPGATDTPGDGIDQDCSDGDASYDFRGLWRRTEYHECDDGNLVDHEITETDELVQYVNIQENQIQVYYVFTGESPKGVYYEQGNNLTIEDNSIAFLTSGGETVPNEYENSLSIENEKLIGTTFFDGCTEIEVYEKVEDQTVINAAVPVCSEMTDMDFGAIGGEYELFVNGESEGSYILKLIGDELIGTAKNCNTDTQRFFSLQCGGFQTIPYIDSHKGDLAISDDAKIIEGELIQSDDGEAETISIRLEKISDNFDLDFNTTVSISGNFLGETIQYDNVNACARFEVSDDTVFTIGIMHNNRLIKILVDYDVEDTIPAGSTWEINDGIKLESIYIWESLYPAADQPIDEEFDEMGLQSGSMTIHSYDGNQMEAQFDLTFSDNIHLTGAFSINSFLWDREGTDQEAEALFEGVWKVTIDNDWEENGVETEAPFVDGEVTANFYWKITNHHLYKFDQIEDVPVNTFFTDSGEAVTNGDIVTCSSNVNIITVTETTITEDEEVRNYEFSNDNNTLKVYDSETDYRIFERVPDPSILDNTLEACSLFEDTSAVQGTWRVTSIQKDCGVGEKLILPVLYENGIQRSLFLKIDEDQFISRYQLSNIPPNWPNEGDSMNDGIYACPDWNITYVETIWTDSVISNGNTTIFFEQEEEDKLSIFMQYEEGGCDIYYAVKLSDEAVAYAQENYPVIENCQVLNTLDEMPYETASCFSSYEGNWDVILTHLSGCSTYEQLNLNFSLFVNDQGEYIFQENNVFYDSAVIEIINNDCSLSFTTQRTIPAGTISGWGEISLTAHYTISIADDGTLSGTRSYTVTDNDNPDNQCSGTDSISGEKITLQPR